MVGHHSNKIRDIRLNYSRSVRSRGVPAFEQIVIQELAVDVVAVC